MTHAKQHNGWREAMRAKSRAIHRQIATLIESARESGSPEILEGPLTASYYAALERHYLEEVPAAMRFDKMLLSMEIEGVDADTALITDAAKEFLNTRDAVKRLVAASTPGGMQASAWGDAPPLGVSTAVNAKGNLIVAFHPHPSTPLSEKVAEALSKISSIAATIETSEDETEDALAKLASEGDPAAVHAAASALQTMMKAKNRKVRRITGAIPITHFRRPIGKVEQAALRHWLKDPLADKRSKRQPSMGQEEGCVREIDIDNRSFILRHPGNKDKGEVRCVVAFTISDELFGELANKYVVVRGQKMLNKEGELRLIRVEGLRWDGKLYGQMELDYESTDSGEK